jgi:hypothetical protein
LFEPLKHCTSFQVRRPLIMICVHGDPFSIQIQQSQATSHEACLYHRLVLTQETPTPTISPSVPTVVTVRRRISDDCDKLLQAVMSRLLRQRIFFSSPVAYGNTVWLPDWNLGRLLSHGLQWNISCGTEIAYPLLLMRI